MAELADVVLPVASVFEREALKIGFEVSQGMKSLVQFRQRVVEPLGECRSDTQIVFDLIIGYEAIDPVSGSVPHQPYMCQVRRVD